MCRPSPWGRALSSLLHGLSQPFSPPLISPWLEHSSSRRSSGSSNSRDFSRVLKPCAAAGAANRSRVRAFCAPFGRNVRAGGVREGLGGELHLGDSEFPRFWHPPWYTSTARPGPRPGGDRGFCRARILGSLSLHDFLTACPARRRRRPTRMMRSSRGPTPRICSRVRASRHPDPGSCDFF